MRIQCDRYFDPPKSGTFCFQIELIYEDPAEEGFVFPSLDDDGCRWLLGFIDKEINLLQPGGTTILLKRKGYSGETIEKAVNIVFSQILFRGIRRKGGGSL